MEYTTSTVLTRGRSSGVMMVGSTYVEPAGDPRDNKSCLRALQHRRFRGDRWLTRGLEERLDSLLTEACAWGASGLDLGQARIR